MRHGSQPVVAWLGARPLLRFAFTVIALLPACFLAWHALGAILAAPALVVANAVLMSWLPELISEIRLDGTQLLVLSAYGEAAGGVLPMEVADNQLAYPVDTRTLSYSIPFFAALYFATPANAGLGAFAWNLLVLWFLLAIGVVSTAAKNLMLGLGDVFFSAGALPPADVIALVYQFSVLMVPPLAPVLLWAYSVRTTPLFAALLAPEGSSAQPSD